MNGKCETCGFHYLGACRRFPPIEPPKHYGDAHRFPYTPDHYWCGEYKPKPDARA